MGSSCPHCGRELAHDEVVHDEVIHVGPWRLSHGLADLDGRHVRLTAAEANVLYALARVQGAVLSPEAIGESFGSRDKSNDTVRALVMRLRKKLGPACPVETIRHRGYRWQLPGEDAGSPARPEPALA